MALLHTGSDELVFIQTEKVSMTIKGQASHPNVHNAEYSDKEATLKVFCDSKFEIELKGDAEPVAERVFGFSHSGEYKTIPFFFEQQRYEIIIENLGNEEVSFWHDNYNIRNKVTAVGRSNRILTGVINFGNEIGLSDFVIKVGNTDYLRVMVEVFPSKISYKNDYQAIVADVTTEIYNIIFDLLKKTYLSYRQNDTTTSSPVEFFAVIQKIYSEFIKAADLILAHPHHQLETIHEVAPSRKIKQIDNRTIRWLERHGDQIVRTEAGVQVGRALSVKKQVTFDTKENRLTKHILQSTINKLRTFKHIYSRLQRETDPYLISRIDDMINGIVRRCNNGFMSEIHEGHSSYGMSLVFSMAPGYRELYRCYLMLLRGLSVTGDLFNISVKDLAVLYEYWCFIKLNSLMKERYQLISQDIVKVQGNGLYVSLVKGRASQVKYRNPRTNEVIILSYNPKEVDVPTVTQRPDNVLTLEKKGADIRYEYVFDAKYRVNPAIPGTDYYRAISHHPGPEVSDINTMHRYRDAIVYRNDASPFERIMFGAYVLFPYSNEQEYQNHRFYQSIDKVNIGGLPFLPSATGMVRELLDSLIVESSESAFERTTLPRGIEAKLAKVDWNTRDVLVGGLARKEQLDDCLRYGFYHIPIMRLKDTELPVRYVALYQSKRLFGSEAGIVYYGEVIKCTPVRRCDIVEMPSKKTEMYYRFDVKEWKKLSKPIVAKEMSFVRHFTNKFLLEHSAEIPELWIRSEAEYRLYSELKRAVNDTAINDSENTLGVSMGDYSLSFEAGSILLCKENVIVGKYEITDYLKSPRSILHRIQRIIDEQHNA